METTIQILPTAQITSSQHEEIMAMMREAFGKSYDEYIWAESDWYCLVWENGNLISHVSILERTCRVGDQPVKVGGIGGVATLPAWRGKGLATQLLNAATQFMQESMQIDFGLLFCDEKMEPFYGGLGWVTINADIYFDQPSGRQKSTGVAMVFPCKETRWQPGEVDLCGYPW